MPWLIHPAKKNPKTDGAGVLTFSIYGNTIVIDERRSSAANLNKPAP
jgi:hypothetical protein